jgi:hypothetical protein
MRQLYWTIVIEQGGADWLRELLGAMSKRAGISLHTRYSNMRERQHITAAVRAECYEHVHDALHSRLTTLSAANVLLLL